MTLQMVYLILLIPIVGGMILVAWWFAGKARPSGAPSGEPVHEAR